MPVKPDIRIVSGGQTGVDRAALDVAHRLGLKSGGWCPKGRRAEDGPISEKYDLKEAPLSAYEQRTLWNIRDSDATLILSTNPLTGGTEFTYRSAKKREKPLFWADPTDTSSCRLLVRWLREGQFDILNIAGPRESTENPIYARANAYLYEVLYSYINDTG